MTPQRAIEALEKEKRLLEDFICLSEEQLLLLERGDLQRFDELGIGKVVANAAPLGGGGDQAALAKAGQVVRQVGPRGPELIR